MFVSGSGDVKVLGALLLYCFRTSETIMVSSRIGHDLISSVSSSQAGAVAMLDSFHKTDSYTVGGRAPKVPNQAAEAK